MSITSNIPSPGVPLIGPDGRLVMVWFQFFMSMYTRTGGVAGQDSSALQLSLEDGATQPDLDGIYALIAAVESLAAQAQAAAIQPRDERGEAGDGANLAQVLARLTDLESRVEAAGAPVISSTSQLTNDAPFAIAGHAALPAAATDATSTQALANAMRSALIAAGVGA